jgi:phosphate transport system protein
MRTAYHSQLDSLSNDLASMAELAGNSMQRATTALLEADLALAEQVIGDDTKLNEVRVSAEEKAFALLALQAPVAGDLRTVVATINTAGDLERMGVLALHVATAARRRHPQHVVPAEVAPSFAEMGRVACDMAEVAQQVLLSRDVALAAQLESDDDAMDQLHKDLFSVMMAPEWPHGVATAVDIALLGRFYERFADHAVVNARRVVFMVTGQMPEEEY